MRPNNSLNDMKSLLKPGNVYRRVDFIPFSSNVDRNLAYLVDSGDLKKLQHGLYAVPKQTDFGEALPNETSLLRSFLNDDHFVVYNASMFNALGLGTTQLYNEQVVFNRKRHGVYTLGKKTYRFYRWREAPKKPYKEFLLVEMLNRLSELAEDQHEVLKNLALKVHKFNRKKLLYAADHYGLKSTKTKLKSLLKQ